MEAVPKSKLIDEGDSNVSTRRWMAMTGEGAEQTSIAYIAWQDRRMVQSLNAQSRNIGRKG